MSPVRDFVAVSNEIRSTAKASENRNILCLVRIVQVPEMKVYNRVSMRETARERKREGERKREREGERYGERERECYIFCMNKEPDAPFGFVQF